MNGDEYRGQWKDGQKSNGLMLYSDGRIKHYGI